jgi:hypothetical protein
MCYQKNSSILPAFVAIGFLAAHACLAQTTARSEPAPGAQPAKKPVTQPGQTAGQSSSKPGDWQYLFDDETLAGWKVTDFAGHGEVTVEPRFRGAPAIVCEMGAMLTGITWTNKPPQPPYELELEAMRVDGHDFFCGLTFPAGDGHCSLIVGGWGGGLVGISSLDGMDASENETTKFAAFESDRWYAIRVRVTEDKIEAWIDKDKMVDVVITDRKVTVRPGDIESSQPLGLAAFMTRAAYRNIRMRDL